MFVLKFKRHQWLETPPSRSACLCPVLTQVSKHTRQSSPRVCLTHPRHLEIFTCCNVLLFTTGEKKKVAVVANGLGLMPVAHYRQLGSYLPAWHPSAAWDGSLEWVWGEEQDHLSARAD